MVARAPGCRHGVPAGAGVGHARKLYRVGPDRTRPTTRGHSGPPSTDDGPAATEATGARHGERRAARSGGPPRRGHRRPPPGHDLAVRGARGRRLVRPTGQGHLRRHPGRGARPQPRRGEGARLDDPGVAPAPRPGARPASAHLPVHAPSPSPRSRSRPKRDRAPGRDPVGRRRDRSGSGA